MDNRRKTVVINKKFQYQYALLTVALTVLAVNLFLIIRMILPGDDQLVLTSTKALGLAAIELALIGGVWYGSLKSSHKVAGPVYVFSREVGRLCRGDLTAHIRLRDNDMFQDTAEELNASFCEMRARIDALKAIASDLAEAGIQDEPASALVAKLNQQLSELITEQEK